MAAKFQTRSVSLPSRSHPTTVKIDEELNKLRTFNTEVASTSGCSSSICNALSGLEEVYICLEELLNMSSTQEALARGLNGKCLDELMDGSVKLLETCEVSKDVMSKLKEEVAALQSAIRRRRNKGSSLEFESSVSSYVSLRKKARKDAKKLAATLKQMDNGKVQISEDDAFIRVIREVNAVSGGVMQSVLAFVSSPLVKQGKQSGKWGIVCKIVKGTSSSAVGCEENVNEIKSADAAAFSLYDEKKELVQRELLGDVEGKFEDVEKRLESVFRKMIKSRASLLNILSQ
ncbi:hypothetical protein LINGRAHAP2_LOCUS31189 [Linum grandiflorum]